MLQLGLGPLEQLWGLGPGVSSIGFLGAGEWMSVLEVAEEQRCPQGWVGSGERVGTCEG